MHRPDICLLCVLYEILRERAFGITRKLDKGRPDEYLLLEDFIGFGSCHTLRRDFSSWFAIG